MTHSYFPMLIKSLYDFEYGFPPGVTASITNSIHVCQSDLLLLLLFDPLKVSMVL